MGRHKHHQQIKKGIAPEGRQILKRALLYFFPVLLLSIGLVAGLYLLLVHQDTKKLMFSEQLKLSNAKAIILVEMESIFSDLLHFAGENELHAYMNDRGAVTRAGLEKDLLSFSKVKPVYSQVRFLDETGMEQVRVNHGRGDPRIVPQEQLQDKSHRYYFKITSRMPQGSIFISPFDLNVEHGRVETPPNPVIRLSTPLNDYLGRPAGMVVLNFKGDVLIDRLSAELSRESYPTVLLNEQGYWLYSENPDQNWGFMYEDKKALTFGNRFPEAWQAMATNRTGQFRNARGLFTYNRIFPIVESARWSDLQQQIRQIPGNAFDYAAYQWILASWISPAALAQRTVKLRWLAMGLVVILAAGGAVLAWFYARSRILDRLAGEMAADIARLNESLIASSSVLSEQMDFTDTLKAALEVAMRLSSAQYGILLIIQHGRIEEYISYGWDGDIHRAVAGSMFDSPLLRKNIAEKRPTRYSDLARHPELANLPPGHPKINSLLAVPLIHQDEVTGSLYLAEKSYGRAFSKQDETIIVTFASHLAAVNKRTALYEEIKLGASIFDNSIEGICVTDVDGTIVKINRAFTAITGYTADEAMGKNPRILKSDRHDADFYKAMWAAITGEGRWEGEIWNRRKNGETYPEWLSISAIRNHTGQVAHYVSIFHDISEVKQSQDRLEYQAHHDALTGLPNRQLFHDRLSVALSGARRHGTQLALLFLDLDDFKLVNDTMGHWAGDVLLKGVAQRLSENIRTEDTVARLGGDEFIVLMTDLKSPELEAVNLAQRIIAALGQPFQLPEKEVTPQTSIGITIFPDDGDTAADLIKNADMAMYRAKNEGKNRYAMFTDEMNRHMLQHVTLEADLRRAVERDELVLHYQPKVDIGSGRLAGAEALVRWNRNHQELTPPDLFIPLAEETGVVLEIGAWVLHQACAQARTWQANGFPDLSVAVNLSPRQLRDQNIQQVIQNALTVSGLPPERLTLEITENVMVDDVEATIAIMERIAALGVRWSMDDFGTGYSSIKYLQQLPLHEIKIDKSFLEGIPGNSANEKIVISTVALARSFNLKVTGEGVEQMSQLQFLSACNGNEAQGYLFSKPLPADAFDQYLKQHGRTNWQTRLLSAHLSRAASAE